MNRRQFLASLAGTGALVLLGNTARSIRVGMIGSANPGAQLGAEEAGRTAELLGARFELVTGEPEGVLVQVGDPAAAKGFEVPFLSTRPMEGEPLRGNVFHVASGPAERRAALARFSENTGPVPEGARVVDWHPSLSRFGAEQLNHRYETRFGSPMDETAWVSWMAVMIAAEVALRNPGAELSSRLERLRFDGHKGARLRFRDRRLVQPLYVVAGDKVLGEVAPEEEE